LVFTSLLFAQKTIKASSPDTLKKAQKEVKQSKNPKTAETGNKPGLKGASDKKINSPQTHTGQNVKQPEVGKPQKPEISDAQNQGETAKPAAVTNVQDQAVPEDKAFRPATKTAMASTAGSGIEEEVYAGKGEFKALEKTPEIIKKVAPVYPLEARERGEQGKVILYLLIDLDGHVRKAEVALSSGFEDLDRAAMESAKQCIFTPAMAPGGKPARVWVMYPVIFKLNN
jgi:periplasmic protein TonB